MAGRAKNRNPRKSADPAYIVALEYEPTAEVEDRLLQVYEFLLGLPDGPEICSEGEEST
jgi:hypothetical protein